MNLLFVDFETFHDKKDGYDLRDLSIVEYVRDPRFKVQGLGLAWDNRQPGWLTNIELLRLNNWDEIAVIGHNLKFDAFILVERYGIVAGQYIDTKALAKAVLGKTVKGFSLKTLAEHFGLEPKGELKTDGKLELTDEEEMQLATYCLHDVELCREIYNRLIVDFPQSQLDMMDWTIRTFIQPKLRLNVEKLEKAAKEEAERRNAVIAASGYPKEVFSSNQKFAKLLEEKGYEVPKKKSPRTGGSIPALALGDVDFLALKGQKADPILRALCEARVAAKSTLLETRASSLAKIGATGPWPFDVEFSGATQTHRFSGGSGAGGNPQNFTRGSVLREAVEAPKGYKLVVGDFSNIELRLVAYLSKDPGLVQAIENNVDLYCDFASAFYGRKITKENKFERQFGKTAILGLGYGMGAIKFKNTVRIQTGEDISEEDAQRAVQLYRRKYNKVPALWERLHSHISCMVPSPLSIDVISGLPVEYRDDSLLLPSGLLIRYPNLRLEGKEWVYDVWDKSKTKPDKKKLYGGKLTENICQALAGELCKEAALAVKDVLVGQVHDELILCVPSAQANMYAGRLRAAMTKSPSWLPEIKLDAEVHVGKNWGECK